MDDTSHAERSHLPGRALEPLPYLRAIRDYLKDELSEVWRWFRTRQASSEQLGGVRLELLKRTYRIEPNAKPELHELAHAAAAKLGIEAPISIYQAQGGDGLNASVAYVPHEVHLVLTGPVSSKLSGVELGALLGHELAHFWMYESWDHEFLTVRDVLAAMSHDVEAETAHLESARHFGLYTEIFCDRVALEVCGDLAAVVAALVKIETGLEEVDPESYLRQAEEIFAGGSTTTEGLTHPEAFIRARALALWSAEGATADDTLVPMIEGPDVLGELDLLGQRRVREATRRVVASFLEPPWLRTESLLAHARLYFAGFEPPTSATDLSRLRDDLDLEHESMGDYYSYVLLDFVTADRELEEGPLAAAVIIARALGLEDRFTNLARQELKLRKRDLEKLGREAEDIVEMARRERSSS